MLAAVFLPVTGTLHAALQAPSARRAIDAGMGLYTNGRQTAFLPQALPGWFRMAVTLRSLLPDDTEAA